MFALLLSPREDAGKLMVANEKPHKREDFRT